MPSHNSPGLPPTGKLWRTDELTDLGYGSRSIKSLLDSGSLVRLRYGCYIRASVWEAQSPRVRSLQLIYSHAHGTRTTSTGHFAYSHTSAARLHSLYLWNVDDLIHLLQRVNPSSERHGRDVKCHTRPFSDDEIVTLNGLRVTSLERTSADCAMLLTYRQSLIVMDHALRRGADRSLLQAMADSLDGRRGVRTFRRALENADARAESPGETLTRALILRLGIKPPTPQFEVTSPIGRHRLDFAWKKEKVALEFDGKVKYFDYKRTDEVLLEERQRENALTEEGWKFLRIVWKDLFNEARFKHRVLHALAGR
ncbi:hypothetical protein [Arthrobacter sp. NPDC056727]|uniref:hypothetical protein n=1 Tax=Arthrobacter sp. NPDC056727 TaxID=3345927 RepID=UPI00366BD586